MLFQPAIVVSWKIFRLFSATPVASLGHDMLKDIAGGELQTMNERARLLAAAFHQMRYSATEARPDLMLHTRNKKVEVEGED